MPDPAPNTKVCVTISAKVIFWMLCIIAVVLAVLGFAAALAAGRDESDLAWPFARQFMFGEEGNFVNWYQSFTLLGCAVLAVIVGLARKTAGGPGVAHWFVMAAVMAFAGIDEAAQIHDRTVNAFIETVSDAPAPAQAKGGEPADAPTGGAKWMFVYLPVGLIFAGAYLRFYLALPKRTKWGLLIAATLYIGGAVVLEMVYEKVAGDDGETTIAYAIDAASELFEMLGVAVFTGTLAALLARERGELAVSFRVGE